MATEPYGDWRRVGGPGTQARVDRLRLHIEWWSAKVSDLQAHETAGDKIQKDIATRQRELARLEALLQQEEELLAASGQGSGGDGQTRVGWASGRAPL